MDRHAYRGGGEGQCFHPSSIATIMKTTTIEKREGILDRGLLESALHALSDGRYRVRFDRERSKAS